MVNFRRKSRRVFEIWVEVEKGMKEYDLYLLVEIRV